MNFYIYTVVVETFSGEKAEISLHSSLDAAQDKVDRINAPENGDARSLLGIRRAFIGQRVVEGKLS